MSIPKINIFPNFKIAILSVFSLFRDLYEKIDAVSSNILLALYYTSVISSLDAVKIIRISAYISMIRTVSYEAEGSLLNLSLKQIHLGCFPEHF